MSRRLLGVPSTATVRDISSTTPHAVQPDLSATSHTRQRDMSNTRTPELDLFLLQERAKSSSQWRPATADPSAGRPTTTSGIKAESETRSRQRSRWPSMVEIIQMKSGGYCYRERTVFPDSGRGRHSPAPPPPSPAAIIVPSHSTVPCMLCEVYRQDTGLPGDTVTAVSQQRSPSNDRSLRTGRGWEQKCFSSLPPALTRTSETEPTPFPPQNAGHRNATSGNGDVSAGRSPGCLQKIPPRQRSASTTVESQSGRRVYKFGYTKVT